MAVELTGYTRLALPKSIARSAGPSSVRTILLALVACVPPMIVWPPDGFDGYFALKAYAVIALGVCLAVWWTVTALRENRLPCKVGLVGALAIGLSLWLTLSTLLSASPSTGVWGFPGRDDGLLVWLSGLLVMATASLACQWNEWRMVFAATIGAGWLLSLYGVAQHFGLDASGLALLGQTGRVFSSFRNPLFFGGYLALIMPLLLCATVTGSRWRRAVAAVGCGVSLAALYFTFSRGAWLGTAGGIAVFTVLAWRAGGKQVRKVLAALGVAVVIAGAIALLPEGRGTVQVHDMKSDLSTLTSVTNDRNDGRLAIWEMSLHMIGDRPLLGVGLDQMTSVFEEYRTARFDAAEGADAKVDRAHSDPLHLAVVAGIPAAILFYALVIIVAGRAALRCVRRRDVPEPLWWCATLAGICAYLAQSLVSITVPGVHTLFFLLLGGLAAWPRGVGSQVNIPLSNPLNQVTGTPWRSTS